MHHELSDNQRRFVCRILFLVLCALPTAFVVYQACHRKSADDWAQLIQSQLSLQTHIGSIETPRPNEVILRDIRFADDNDDEVFSALEATILFGKRNRIIIDDQLSLTMSGLSHVLNQVAEKAVNPRFNQQTWNIEIRDAVLYSEADSISGQRDHLVLTPVNIFITPSRDGMRATLSTPIPNQDSTLNENWVICELERGQTVDDLRVEIDTGSSLPIPCWLAYPWFPELKKYGNQAQFAGMIELGVGEDASKSDSLAGSFEFSNVDISNTVKNDSAIAQNPVRIEVRKSALSNSDDVGATLVFEDGTRQAIRSLYSERLMFDVDQGIQAAFQQGLNRSANGRFFNGSPRRHRP